MTDPISDMLTRIKNALAVGHEAVVLPTSKIKRSLAEVLLANGYLENVEVIKAKPVDQLKLTLKYTEDKQPVISEIKRVSKPSCRVYVGSKDIPQILNGFGLSVLSTSAGILTGREARAKHLGGELLCELW